MRTFATAFDLELIGLHVLSEPTRNTYSFLIRKVKITHSFTLVESLVGYGRVLGPILFLFTHLGGSWGHLSHSPTLPGIDCHILPGEQRSGPSSVSRLSQQENALSLSPLLGSPPSRSGSVGVKHFAQVWISGPRALSPVGVGTSDFLGLGSLRASFASSHPVPFTPWLFYCFITFFRALVAKDSDGAILQFLTLPNPKSCCFKQFGHLQRLPFQI